ncbi:MAG: AEC family transporter [Alphaproteobacteria bacterium]|nr:AEC family transporter [Alphaproteobacteria bacterium]
MIAELLGIVAPVFLIAALGFVWARMEQPFDTLLVTHLLTNVTTPCLIFSRVAPLKGHVATFGLIAGLAVVSLLVFALLGYLGARLLRLPVTASVGPVMFPNCGNMGLALCLFAFGEVGVGLGIGFFIVMATTQFTLAPWIASGRFSLRQMVRAPVIYASAVSILFLAAGIHVPTWLFNTTKLLGDVSIPMMLITLGVSLARLRVVSLRNSLMVALLRLGIGFATGAGLVWAFGLSGPSAGVILIMCSMPPAVFNYLFAARYSDHAEEVAGTVIIATALSFATMPLLMAYALG